MFLVEVPSEAFLHAIYYHKSLEEMNLICIPVFPSKVLSLLKDIVG
jgi:hypothetical protein